MQTKYTKSFKMEAVKKALMHDNGTNITEVAKNLGLPKSTLYGWVQAMKGKGKPTPSLVKGA
jgi:transposase-like protein